MKNLLTHFSSSSLFTLLIGSVCVIATSLPLFHSGFFRPHDYTHVARIVEMNRSLQAFEFPARWSENFGFGYGMPLFNFYAPLPYYLAQVPYILSQNGIFALRVLFLFNSVLAFVGMYFFAKEFWKSTFAGQVSAILFTFATYRALDIFVRGALGEVMAMVLIPFALFAVVRFRSNQVAGSLLLSVSLASILLSHNLTGMIMIGVVLAFALTQTRVPRQLFILALSVFAALGLSSFYTLPSFFEKNFTRIEETITTGYFDYHNHFVALRQFLFGKWGYGGSVPGLEDGISFAIGWVPVTICLVAGLVCLLSLLRRNKKESTGFYSAVILSVFAVGSMFMATNKSVLIWDSVPVLKFLQFPWRFLSFVHVFVAALAGGVTWIRPQSKAIQMIGVGILCLAMALLNVRYFIPEKYIDDANVYYSSDPVFIRTELSKTLNDYLPKAISDTNLPMPQEFRLHSDTPNAFRIVKNTPTRITAQTNCANDCVIDVNIFQFPGWTATLDGKSLDLLSKTDFPSYSVSVPSGAHTLSVQLHDTAIRRIGNAISLVSIGLIAFLYVSKRSKTRL